MDKLSQQIRELDFKLSRLYQLIERLTGQVNFIISEKNSAKIEKNQNPLLSPDVINHQDVLIDDDGENINTINQDPIEPDVQIRRLTAQLTAAYNRIAALEEQLMYRSSGTY